MKIKSLCINERGKHWYEMSSLSDQLDRQIARIDVMMDQMDDREREWEYERKQIEQCTTLIILWYNWFNVQYKQLFIDKQSNERFSGMYLCLNDLYLGESLPVERFCLMFVVMALCTHLRGDVTLDDLHSLLMHTVMKTRGKWESSEFRISEQEVQGGVGDRVGYGAQFSEVVDVKVVDVEQCLFELLFCMSALGLF